MAGSRRLPGSPARRAAARRPSPRCGAGARRARSRPARHLRRGAGARPPGGSARARRRRSRAAARRRGGWRSAPGEGPPGRAIIEPGGCSRSGCRSPRANRPTRAASAPSSTSTNGEARDESSALSLGTIASQTAVRSLERLPHVRAERLDPIERRGDVLEQDVRVVVALVDRDPGERARVACGPLGKECRLAVAGRCDDEHEREGAGGAKPVDERRPGNVLGLPRRDGASTRRRRRAEQRRVVGPTRIALAPSSAERTVRGRRPTPKRRLLAVGIDIDFALPSSARLSRATARIDALPSEYPRASAPGTMGAHHNSADVHPTHPPAWCRHHTFVARPELRKRD